MLLQMTVFHSFCGWIVFHGAYVPHLLFFLFYFTILYWFCHTLTWICHGCTCVPILNTPLISLPTPSLSSQCTSPEHPVSCIKPGLVICFMYDNIHVSMLFSQITPPSPCPTESNVCSLHLCLFCCLTYRVIITIFLSSIYICIKILYWCFFFWLTSHIVADNRLLWSFVLLCFLLWFFHFHF